MKVLITGAGGQLGWELLRSAPSDWQVVGWERSWLDITVEKEVVEKIGALQPQWVINAAAYTAVDRAESQPDEARAVNHGGVVNLSRAVQRVGGKLLHLSTDYVFDGSRGRPWGPEDAVAPLGEYGRSKLAGERAALDLLGENLLLVRTAWLYSSRGHNFVQTMLRLMREGRNLSVVMDQTGSPTWAFHLATALWGLLERDVCGILHWCNAGVASWYDFAVAIQQLALQMGVLSSPVTIHPIPSSAYPTAATRPAFSVLDCTKSWEILASPAPHWQTALASMLQEVAGESRL
ncbi:MAG: dTDP-4-dehydrorhamnose reductase [Magnetococcales bacterium]|nr:dTDP-4-dehydrorhamnose reductase [Magnetococcales bacterium]NGZ27696.1 dTDP-4-dehydrorhamnose reductase [Magnetococcales bacterium]